tara:strand:+ start:1053 stop:1283 length:231 start_codon:yes stop_codon:yes gene_type:complete
MIEGLNSLLEQNDIMCRIGSVWYKLESISISDKATMPIIVSDDDGGEHQFDMADIDEFDPMFETFRGMDNHIIGEA